MLLGEPDAPRILAELDRFDGLVSSRLLGLELRRVALRESVLDVAERLLRAVALVSIDESLLARAEVVHPATVATLDAVHLTTALQIAAAGNLDALFTYDRQLAAAAEHHGLSVLAPS